MNAESAMPRDHPSASAKLPERSPAPRRGDLAERLKRFGSRKNARAKRCGFFLQFALFCVAGTSGMLVGFSTVALLYQALGVPFELANLVSYFTAVTTNFVVNRRITFPHARKTAWLKQYLLFVGGCAAGGALNWLTAVGLFRASGFFREKYLLACLVGVAVGVVANFLAARFLVFRAPGAAPLRSPD